MVKIKNEQDYQAALARIEELLDAEPDTEEYYELDALASIIEIYEEKTFPMRNISLDTCRMGVLYLILIADIAFGYWIW